MQAIQLNNLPHQQLPICMMPHQTSRYWCTERTEAQCFVTIPHPFTSVNYGLLWNEDALSSPPSSHFIFSMTPPPLRILHIDPLTQTNNPLHHQPWQSYHTDLALSGAMVLLMARCRCQPSVRGGSPPRRVCFCRPRPLRSPQLIWARNLLTMNKSLRTPLAQSSCPGVDLSSRQATRLTAVILLQHLLHH